MLNRARDTRAGLSTRSLRCELLMEIFDAQEREFTEDNLPTAISTFFEDVVKALPEGSKDCNIEELFKNARKKVYPWMFNEENQGD